MLSVGARRPAAGLSFVAGDALWLPFGDAAFDVVTISFGLRNVADTGQALAELLRVTRPGGRLVICEFSHLPVRRLNALYEQYLTRVLPVVARRLSGNAEAYDYLAESIRDWPAQHVLAGTAGGGRLVRRELAEPDPRRRRAARGAASRLACWECNDKTRNGNEAAPDAAAVSRGAIVLRGSRQRGAAERQLPRQDYTATTEALVKRFTRQIRTGP